jgi:hypothetical protein
VSHLSITKASVTSAFTFVVGQVVAFVPAFGPDKQALISAGTSLIAAVFLIANSIHKLADSKVSIKDVENHAIEVAKAELGKVNLDSLAANAVNGNLPDVPSLVRREIATVLSQMFNQPVTADVPAPVAPPAQAAPVDL